MSCVQQLGFSIFLCGNIRARYGSCGELGGGERGSRSCGVRTKKMRDIITNPCPRFTGAPVVPYPGAPGGAPAKRCFAWEKLVAWLMVSCFGLWGLLQLLFAIDTFTWGWWNIRVASAISSERRHGSPRWSSVGGPSGPWESLIFGEAK